MLAGCGSKLAAAVDAPPIEVDAAPVMIDAATVTIPVTMVTVPGGNSVPTVQVSINGSAPFTAELDTGSMGLRVVTGTIPDAAWTISSTTSTVTYGSGVVADGVLASGAVSIGSYTTTAAIAVEDITTVSCVAAKPNCPADGVDAAAFRFAGTFPAMLGVGFRSNARIASPLAMIGANHQYTLSLPPFGGTAGVLTIDPDASTIARFDDTRIQLPSDGTGFDDVTVPVCVNSLCVSGLIDTGQPAFVLATSSDSDLALAGVPAGSTVAPAGTSITASVGGNESWSFQVGATPAAGKDLVRFDGTAAVNNAGIAPFHLFDMFYDYAAGVIGIAPKP